MYQTMSPRQAPLSMGFSRPEYWSGLPVPPPGDLPDPGMETASLVSPASAGRFFTTSATWTLSPQVNHRHLVQIIYLDTEQVFALIISSHLILSLIREEPSLSLFGKEIGTESLLCCPMTYSWWSMIWIPGCVIPEAALSLFFTTTSIRIYFWGVPW